MATTWNTAESIARIIASRRLVVSFHPDDDEVQKSLDYLISLCNQSLFSAFSKSTVLSCSKEDLQAAMRLPADTAVGAFKFQTLLGKLSGKIGTLVRVICCTFTPLTDLESEVGDNGIEVFQRSCHIGTVTANLNRLLSFFKGEVATITITIDTTIEDAPERLITAMMTAMEPFKETMIGKSERRRAWQRAAASVLTAALLLEAPINCDYAGLIQSSKGRPYCARLVAYCASVYGITIPEALYPDNSDCPGFVSFFESVILVANQWTSRITIICEVIQRHQGGDSSDDDDDDDINNSVDNNGIATLNKGKRKHDGADDGACDDDEDSNSGSLHLVASSSSSSSSSGQSSQSPGGSTQICDSQLTQEEQDTLLA
jgi:hypothetical protein